MTDKFQTIFSHLESLIIHDSDFSKIQNNFNRFCIFEATGIVHNEIRLGNFLATFLQPSGSHGYGSAVLRTLLMEALRQSHRANAFEGDIHGLHPLKIHLMALENAIVLREYKNIDILIKISTENLVVAVELKIESKQGENQLSRYRKILDNEFKDWNKIYIFLTVHSEDPDDNAWIPLRYSNLIPALEKIEGISADPLANVTFHAFLDMFKRHHMTDPQLDEIASVIWSKHKEALEFLIERRPDIQGAIFKDLLHNIPPLVNRINSNPGSKFEFEASEPNKRDIIRFSCRQWDDLPGFRTGDGSWTKSCRLILFELKKQEKGINAFVYLGPGPQVLRDKIASAVLGRNLQNVSHWKILAQQEIFTENDDCGEDVSSYIAARMAGFCQQKAAELTLLIAPIFEKWKSPEQKM
ncbi:PD-(D/E)XK nuclease family protein [Segnochrobactraceae bacterium EtOH-i3]